MQQVSFTIKEWEVVKAEMDGEDVLDDVDVNDDKRGNQTTLEFEKDHVSKPTPWTMPGSNFSIRVGLMLKLKK